MDLSTDIGDFTRRDITLCGRMRPVLTLGDAGPAVIVIHEVYGFTPTLARFCRWLRDGGLRVYAPVLFGAPDASNETVLGLRQVARVCVSREFTILAANKSSPVTVWLRALAKFAHAECGGPGVGAVGMCVTGGFALSMAIDPVMLAPVLAEPSSPALAPAALDISSADLAVVARRCADEGLCVRGYRFEGDGFCRRARFETLRRALGPGFVGVELPDAAANPAGFRAHGKPPHSVFTGDLLDEAGNPTRAAVDEVIGFFRDRLTG